MPVISLTDGKKFEVETGKRLVLALKDNGVDILHRCGGYAKCTTCRVTFAEGEPETMTVAEHDRLVKDNDLLGKIRLSCQIPCDQDMTVEAVYLLSEMALDSPGDRPKDQITPEPEWMSAPRG
ncbi:MAG: 2Fe-2S iron-sulfur cluster-binding protein [Chloroflexota bacterium]